MYLDNQIVLIGNVGVAPETRGKTRDDKLIVSFAIAQNVTKVDPKTKVRVRQDSQWFNISCFAGLAERAQANLMKGDLVMVVGEPRSRSYTNKAGEKRVSFEVTARELLKVERLRSVKGLGAGEIPEEEMGGLEDGSSFENFQDQGIST